MESFGDQAEVIVCSINKDTKEATVENFLVTRLQFANIFFLFLSIFRLEIRYCCMSCVLHFVGWTLIKMPKKFK